jgi:hypothetical protein
MQTFRVGPEHFDDIANAAICELKDLFLGVGCRLPQVFRDVPQLSCSEVLRQVLSGAQLPEGCHDCGVRLKLQAGCLISGKLMEQLATFNHMLLFLPISP